MSSVPIAAELLAAVEASPRATAGHDKSAWVGLFADDGRVEDPVGSRPHIGHAEIGRFYDTFIGPFAEFEMIFAKLAGSTWTSAIKPCEDSVV